MSESDLKSNILDCGGGPASFNAELTRRGAKVVSCDPIYRFSATELSQRIEETHTEILAKTQQSQKNFVWTDIASVEDLKRIRMDAMKLFLQDFSLGLAEGRYQVAELPTLPFHEQQFDLALCSHFLFTYDNLLACAFHLDSIRELCRVAREVRIFPLLPSFGKEHSIHVPEIMRELSAESYKTSIQRVPYEFQKGGNQMLVVSRT